ncbi:hypothetical protein LCM20_08005 [Halobacillus litoralis]|uniref:hypothetical protein n=1 Tax=Halobacillus litoralis TaxID=45668 RepID=UPI001CD7A9AB|nr:hypothetical protein [Halobacillus litoralis]MCA0970525.1 hypothetical protein [Halobacillus litoralis]
MFTPKTHLEIKPEAILKSQSGQYSVRSNKNLLAMIEEESSESNSWKDHALRFSRLHLAARKVFVITTPKAEIIASFTKERGFNKDHHVHDAEGNLLVVIKQDLKMRRQTLNAFDPEGHLVLQARGQNESLTFNVTTEESEDVLSTIKKRSLPAPSLKEVMVSGDYYKVENHPDVTSLQQLLIMVMTVVIYDQLHHA